MNAPHPLAHTLSGAAGAALPALAPDDASGGMALLLRIGQRLAQVLAVSGSAAQVAPKIVGAIVEPMGWACGAFLTRDAEAADRLVCLGAWGVDAPEIAEYLGHTHGRRPILHSAGT